jgi:hypothetical protein
MCQLWRYFDTTMASGWDWSLPVQRVRAVPQDEWYEPSAYKTVKEAGE